MFTGIIKDLGRVIDLQKEGSNVHLRIASGLSASMSIDQSVAHDGICLTVVEQDEESHLVTAVKETLDRTTLGLWQPGRLVNLELASQMGARLDGHMVQGHVDTTAVCTDVVEQGGSWHYHFRYDAHPERVLVDKGSICINGVSLTVVSPSLDTFSVAIIPYTWEHTNFHQLAAGDRVNLEFDIIGKYVARYMSIYQQQVQSIH